MDEQNKQSVEPVKGSKNIRAGVIAVIIIAILLGGAAFIYQINGQIVNVKKSGFNLNTKTAKLNSQLLEIRGKRDSGEVDKLAGWKTYANKDDGYSISHPSEFWPQKGGNLMNYDISDPLSAMGNSSSVKIQIQKNSLYSSNKSLAEYKEYLMNIEDDLVDQAAIVELGNFVELAQYTKGGPGGAFMAYVAFDDNNYYNILIFEPGYSNNKELIESIVETFTIL